MGMSEHLSKTGRLYTLRRRRDMEISKTEIYSHLMEESQFTSIFGPKISTREIFSKSIHWVFLNLHLIINIKISLK